MRTHASDFVVGFLCLVSFVCISVAQFADGGPDKLWSRDLLPQLSRTESGYTPAAGTAFLDDIHLVVYAVEKDLGQLSDRESPEVSSPFRLHVWIVDADSGKVNAHREWGTRSWGSAVLATSGGILVKVGTAIKVYDRTLSQASELPVALDSNGTYYVSVSLGGNRIALSHYFRAAGRYVTHLDVIDARTLKSLYSWDQWPPIFELAGTDRMFDPDKVDNLGFKHKDRSRKRPRAKNCPAGGYGAIVSDDLFARRDCESVALVDANGDSSVLAEFNGFGTAYKSQGPVCEPFFKDFSRKASVATKGQFVALVLPSLKIKKPLFGESVVCVDAVRIGVFDVVRKKQTANIDAGIHLDDFDFALSPDGSRLAVLRGRDISVYSLANGR